MKVNKEELVHIIKEEIGGFAQEKALSAQQIHGIVDRLIDKLDSIDMSLDMIYGAVLQTDAPISTVRARQRAYGRLASAGRSRVPKPQPGE